MTTTYNIDTSHSAIDFSIRHLMIAKVRGRFADFTGSIELDEADLTRSTVKAEIKVASITTANEQRDTHLRSPDFFDAEKFPLMTFASHKIEKKGDDLVIHGELTIHGITKPFTLEVENLGKAADPWGNQRVAFAAKGSLDRKQFGLTWNQVLEAGGFVVGDKVEIALDVQAIRAAARSAA